jgi:hypothetical protein
VEELTKEPEEKKEKISPFVWVDALCTKSKDLLDEHGPEAFKGHLFLVNRAMSQYSDCIFAANELNQFRDVDPLMAWDYYWNSIRAKKRFAKWGKKKNTGDVVAVMEVCRVSRPKAEEAMKLLTKDQLKRILEIAKERTDK